MSAIDKNLPSYPTLVHVLAETSMACPTGKAVICGETEIAYGEYVTAVVNLADQLLDLGVEGGRVLVMMPNSAEAAVVIMAVMAAGAQVSPVNPFFTVDELRPIFRDAEAKVVIADQACVEKARALADENRIDHVLVVEPDGRTLEKWLSGSGESLADRHFPKADAPALLIFTGGTTGSPKGVNHSHASLEISIRQHCTIWPIDVGNERFLNVAPLYHIWGLDYALLVPAYARSTLVIVPKYSPDVVLKAFDQHEITIFAGGPAPIYMGLLDRPLLAEIDFSALKYSLSGGAPCPERLHSRWKELTGSAIYEGYGMSEGAPIACTPANREIKILSVGPPAPGVRIRIADLDAGTRQMPPGEIGEVQVQGPQFTSGYRNKPEETAKLFRDGWLCTGDIAYLDEAGYLFLVDRKKDMVIVGGYNVYPREVDEILFQHPKIAEAATLGKGDERLGEVMVAYVVLKPGESMEEEAFFQYCNEKMVKYKRPVEVTFVDALPRTGVNKINKRALKALSEQQP